MSNKFKDFFLCFFIAVPLSVTTALVIADKDFRDDYAGIVQHTLPVLIQSAGSRKAEDDKPDKEKNNR